MLEAGMTIVENSSRLRYTVLYKSIDMVCIVANYANAVPQNLHLTYVIENFEIIEEGGAS